MADEGAGVIVGGDIGGVFAEDIANQLVDGIVALFQQRLIYGGQGSLQFLFPVFLDGKRDGGFGIGHIVTLPSVQSCGRPGAA